MEQVNTSFYSIGQGDGVLDPDLEFSIFPRGKLCDSDWIQVCKEEVIGT